MSIPTFYPARSKAAQEQLKDCPICWEVVEGRNFNHAVVMCKKCKAAFDGKELPNEP